MIENTSFKTFFVAGLIRKVSEGEAAFFAADNDIHCMVLATFKGGDGYNIRVEATPFWRDVNGSGELTDADPVITHIHGTPDRVFTVEELGKLAEEAILDYLTDDQEPSIEDEGEEGGQ